MGELKYRIRDWDRLYESAQGRRVDKCRYGCIPNKQDGLQYQRMVSNPETFPFYGAFVAVALTCSKQRTPREGWLTDTGRENGIAYTAQDLHVKTGGVPTEIIQGMLDYCSATDCMGTDTWIIKYEDGEATSAPAEISAGEKLRRKRRREDKKVWDSYAEQLDTLRERGDEDGETEWWEKLKGIYGKSLRKVRPHIEKAQKAMAQRRENRADE